MNRTNRQSRACRHLRRRGVSAVEFALVLPVLLILVGGAVDFGRCFYTHIAVTNAARAGAEFASTHPVTVKTLAVWQADIGGVVARELGDRFTETPVVAAPMPAAEGSMKRASVTVTYPFETVVTWPGVPDEFLITRTVQMRMIR